MSFQPDPDVIRWKLRLRASPGEVYVLLATDEGRARFWAESAVESNGQIQFRFPNGYRYDGEILAAEPSRFFRVRYIGGTTATFQLAPTAGGGTDLTLTDEGNAPEDRTEVIAGWVSVLLALKAAADHGVDIRNHDAEHCWDQGYAEN